MVTQWFGVCVGNLETALTFSSDLIFCIDSPLWVCFLPRSSGKWIFFVKRVVLQNGELLLAAF